jgi:hypothetical protein
MRGSRGAQLLERAHEANREIALGARTGMELRPRREGTECRGEPLGGRHQRDTASFLDAEFLRQRGPGVTR